MLRLDLLSSSKKKQLRKRDIILPWDITEKNEGLVIIFLVNLSVSLIHVDDHTKK
jgi:hypothetical protein